MGNHGLLKYLSVKFLIEVLTIILMEKIANGKENTNIPTETCLYAKRQKKNIITKLTRFLVK